MGDKYLKELFEFLSIPSISAQTKHAKDIKKASLWLKKKLSSLGFHSEVLPTQGHPVVYAELINNEKYKTIMIYGHYDVQSPDPLSEWTSKPFDPKIRSGSIYARGVADDKGQLYTWIAALDSLKKEKLKINVKFLIEGEEEVGSANLEDFVKNNKALLKSDICVLSDSHCLSETQPVIEYGLRGLVYAQIDIKTAPKDAHSGIYGGNILNPIQVLSQIIGNLKNEKHQILVPGFYKDVRNLSFLEKNKLKKIPIKEKQILDETGAKIIAGESGFNIHERRGSRPTLDVNGIWGGYQGEGPKTIIPGSAHAKISMRLVPHQNPQKIYKKFTDFIQKIKPEGVDIETQLLSTAEPVIVNTKNKFFKAAENSYKKVFGNKPIYKLSGGTIGVVADLKNILGIDSILMGYGLPDDGLHSPNEKFSLKMFRKGIKTNIRFLKSL